MIVTFDLTTKESHFAAGYTLIYKKNSKNEWAKLHEAENLSGYPCLDLDGDGVPETVGFYIRDQIVWKISPKVSPLIKLTKDF